MWKGINKRQFPRFQITLELNIAFHDKVTYLEATTDNVGVGGICFMSTKRMEPFQEVTLKLLLTDGSLPIECNGRVSWMVEKHSVSDLDTQYDIGIEFLNINSSDTARIEKLISEKERV